MQSRLSLVCSRLVLGATLLCAPTAVASAQTHAYLLNNTFADLFGGPSLAGLGGTLSAGGYSFASGQGLTLGLNLGTEYSLVFRSELDETSGYRKQVDFKNATTDEGYYNLDGKANFYNVSTGSNIVYTPNVFATTVLTRTNAGLFTAYVNGVQQLQFSDVGMLGVVSPANVLRFFLDDPVVPNEQTGGTLTYLATYNTALTASQVANLVLLTPTPPPQSTVPEPGTVALVAAGLSALAGARRYRRR